MSFLTANTQDGFGEHRDKKYPNVYNEIYCCIFDVVGLYFCWRSWTSCLDTWHHGFYQIPTDKKSLSDWLCVKLVFPSLLCPYLVFLFLSSFCVIISLRLCLITPHLFQFSSFDSPVFLRLGFPCVCVLFVLPHAPCVYSLDSSLKEVLNVFLVSSLQRRLWQNTGPKTRP